MFHCDVCEVDEEGSARGARKNVHVNAVRDVHRKQARRSAKPVPCVRGRPFRGFLEPPKLSGTASHPGCWFLVEIPG